MTQKYIYGAWFILTCLATLVILAIRFRRISKLTLKLDEFIDLALSVLGGVSGMYLIFQTWSNFDQLQKIVSNEGLVAMTLGGIASIWFCAGKIRELCVKP
ncbi:hypothetical protein NIES2100_13910 [Calothrix sp. NIES-2100]|uniref:hypothetical protein n=1 Tax=Calothrix sp. NIES-2100 TaxID=1954172 RepID=UPI000B5EFF1D|nr:hypothetical protein NIES2100_13910 [Calothrix sp. NIES-2100]